MIIKRRGLIGVGEAVETSGGRLPCRYVIHTVGPRWNEHGRGKSMLLLRQACLASLHLHVPRASRSLGGEKPWTRVDYVIFLFIEIYLSVQFNFI